ncbi:MAG: GNAT family N-acetyltransferase [Bacteroidota bacterium]
MITTIRVNSGNHDFINLVKQLDADLATRDGDAHPFFAQFNTIITIKYAVVAYENGIPAGCGAIKEYEQGIMEVKRMFTVPSCRGKGVATMVLAELERWSGELACKKCILETGQRQPEAIELYKKNGYTIIPNYGQYVDVKSSVCFEKHLLY